MKLPQTAHLQHQHCTMTRTLLLCGLIAGTLVSIFMLGTVNYLSHCEGNVDYNSSMLIGYASMLLALSLVYVGVRNYRNKIMGGYISFGKAFRTGLLIVLVASTLYVMAWLIYFFFVNPHFMDKMSAAQLNDLRTSGASEAEINNKAAEIARFDRLYRNPFFNALMTYLEILPVGLVVSLVSALILKRKMTASPATP